MTHIDIIGNTSLSEQFIEIVERKGLGHPDTICDALVENVSIKLSQEYIKRFGTVLHHNIDKAYLVAGKSEIAFGGGSIIEPIRFIYGDRATTYVDGYEPIPVKEISDKAVNSWIKENLIHSPPYHIIPECVLKEGSDNLKDIFNRGGKYLGANDTSAVVGYAPKTELEESVIELENHINSKKFKDEHPESGMDVKVMSRRYGNEVSITLANAIIDKEIRDIYEYRDTKYKIKKDIFVYLTNKWDDKNLCLRDLKINALDKYYRGKDGLYLTVSGLSAESGDSGQVGRGNNPAGVIPVCRPASAEAASGKNPVSHVGKIYSVLANKMAEAIYDNIDNIKEVYVHMVSEIGKPINEPALVSVKIIEDGYLSNTRRIDRIVDEHLENMDTFIKNLQTGKFKTY